MDIQQSWAIIGQGDSCKAIFCALLADVWPYLVHLVGRERKHRTPQMTRYHKRPTLISLGRRCPCWRQEKMEACRLSREPISDKHLEQGWRVTGHSGNCILPCFNSHKWLPLQCHAKRQHDGFIEFTNLCETWYSGIISHTSCGAWIAVILDRSHPHLPGLTPFTPEQHQLKS